MNKEITSNEYSLPVPKALISAITTVFVFLFFIGGCNAPSNDVAHLVESPEQFSYSGTAEVPNRWWTVFDDEQLNAFVQDALESNLTLKTAWQRLREAQAVVKRESANLYPSVDGFLDAEKDYDQSTETDEVQLGLVAAYEVDLWGRVGSNVEAEKYLAKASYADYQIVALSLSAETTLTWFRLTEAYNQIDLIEKQIEANRKILELLKTRFSSGQIRTTDILRQQQLLESTKEQLILTESRAKILEHRLAVLLGKPPQTMIDYTYKDLPELPPLPQTGIPIELVQRRPDVLTALNLLKSADSRIAAAVSNQYPRLTIDASLYTYDDDAANLFDNWARSFGGSLVGPLLDAGRREAEVERTRAFRDQRLYIYGQTVLKAFEEIEDALILELKQTEQIESLKEQTRLAEKTLKRLQHEYLNGIANYIDVLTTLNDAQELRRELLSAKLILLEYRIALYRALAGGFNTEIEEKI